MNISDLNVENGLSQISLILQRIKNIRRDSERDLNDFLVFKDMITLLFEEREVNVTDELYDMGAAMYEFFKDGYPIVVGKEVFNFHTIPSDETANDLSFTLRSERYGEDDVLIDSNDIIIFDSTGYARVAIDPQAYSYANTPVNFRDFIDLYLSNVVTESSAYIDMCEGVLSGNISKLTDLVGLLGSKINFTVGGMADDFNSMLQSIQSGSMSFADQFASFITNKFTIGSYLSVSNRHIDAELPEDFPWSVTSVNTYTTATILKGATTILGTILGVVGGGAFSLVGHAISGVSSLITNIDSKIGESEQVTIIDEAGAAMWPDNQLNYDTSIEAINSYYGTDLTIAELPIIVDTGFSKLLINNQYDASTGSLTDTCSVREYSKALFLISNDSLSSLSSILTTYIGSFNLTYYTDSCICCIPNYVLNVPAKISDNLKTAINDWIIENQCSEDQFAAYSDTEKKICYAIGHFLSSLFRYGLPYGLTQPTAHGNVKDGWLCIHVENEVTTNCIPSPTLCWASAVYGLINLADSKKPTWAALVNGISKRFYNYEWTGLSTSFRSIMQLESTVRSITASVTCIEHVTNSQTGVTQWFDYQESIYVQNNAHFVSMRELSGDLLDYNTAASAVGGSYIAKYYTPRYENVSSTLKGILIALGITIAVAGTIYLGFRLTRNKRQAKKYAEYYNATEAYKANPTKENLKIMNRATRSLNFDQKFFGSSKYLATLSTAKFGWDSGSDESSTPSGESIIDTFTKLARVDQSYAESYLATQSDTTPVQTKELLSLSEQILHTII